jgi:hypothetical protein
MTQKKRGCAVKSSLDEYESGRNRVPVAVHSVDLKEVDVEIENFAQISDLVVVTYAAAANRKEQCDQLYSSARTALIGCAAGAAILGPRIEPNDRDIPRSCYGRD